MTGYTQVSIIVDGALEDEHDVPDTDAGRIVLDSLIQNTRDAAEADGLPTEVYTVYHPHPDDADECACVQYLTDHHPDYAWNV